jgi:hypothetical protein
LPKAIFTVGIFLHCAFQQASHPNIRANARLARRSKSDQERTGQLVSACESFSGKTEHSVDETIAVTDKNHLLRGKNVRLIRFIRK